MSDIPEGGACLSVFLILWNGSKNRVLMGKVNPEYLDWEHIGALNKTRLGRYRDKWMLPSSHLVLYESPKQAAERILKEQLGLEVVKLGDPIIFTEVYDIEPANLKNHWDFEFVFLAELERNAVSHPAWAELEFVDVSTMADDSFARNHQDILAQAGLRRNDEKP
jgi:ADP-ribose pyrophosphatase YjhB (NUDIX family)